MGFRWIVTVTGSVGTRIALKTSHRKGGRGTTWHSLQRQWRKSRKRGEKCIVREEQLASEAPKKKGERKRTKEKDLRHGRKLSGDRHGLGKCLCLFEVCRSTLTFPLFYSSIGSLSLFLPQVDARGNLIEPKDEAKDVASSAQTSDQEADEKNSSTPAQLQTATLWKRINPGCMISYTDLPNSTYTRNFT